MAQRELIISTCTAVSAACDVARRSSQRDVTTMSIRLASATQELVVAKASLLSHRKRVDKYGRFPWFGGYVKRAARQAVAPYKDAVAAVNSIRTTISTYKTDTQQAASLHARAANCKSRVPASMQMDFPGTWQGNAEALALRAKFVAANDLHISARRCEGLREVTRVMDSLDTLLTDSMAWTPPPPAPMRGGRPQSDKGAPLPFRPLSGAVGTVARQVSMDFSGQGKHAEVTRIWLPVPYSRMREMISMGARYDPEAPKRGSRVWVPLDEAERFDAVLPLAFRQEPTRFSYPPIRHGAVQQNLGKVFDRESWSRIRNDAYDRAGHRCQVCGKQGGKMWDRVSPSEERRTSGPVDCHEVWDWTVPDLEVGVGVQRLRRLLVLCKDCHMSFHEGFALHKGRQAGLEAEVRTHIEKLRMLTNRLPLEAVREGVQADRVEWESNKDVTTWVLDLSHIAVQDIMSDHTLVLDTANSAGVGPSLIGGIEFMASGERYAAVPAAELAAGASPQLSGQRIERRI